MSQKLTCPECDAPMTVPDEVAGKRIRCKSCQAVIRAGTADVDVVEDEPAPKRRSSNRDEDRPSRRVPEDDEPRSRRRDDDDEDEEEEDDRPARKSGKKSKKKKKSSLPFIFGLFAALLLVIGATAAVLWSRGAFDTDQTKGGTVSKEVSKAIPRKAAEPEPDDLTIHVQLKVVKLGDIENVRLAAALEFAFPKPQKNYVGYFTVREDQDGKQTTRRLAGTDIKDGKGNVMVVGPRVGQRFQFRFWIAKQKSGGSEKDLTPVSNVIDIDLEP